MAEGTKHDEHSFTAGSVIGEKYCVVQKLGAGGMGAVYEAVNTWTARRVAVKVLLSSASGRPDLEQRFMQEAQAAARLRHPNIIDVLDMGRDPGTGALYIVQECLDGIDLFDQLAVHGPFLARDAMEIIVPVMGALIAAHERGVLHRDIKPENIFLAKGKGSERVPKLIDFGVAKLLSGARSARQTDSGQVIGTIHYMSPEQARAEPTLDARSDVWAIGVVLYEMLTGELPFDADNANTLVVRLMAGAPVAIETLAPDLPDSICAIVHKALAVDINLRFQSMREMLDAVIASELYKNDPPERSVLTRHMRSLPTYSAQIRPSEADLAGMAVVLPKAPKALSGLSFQDVDKMAENAVEALESESKSESEPSGVEKAPPNAPKPVLPSSDIALNTRVPVLSSPPKSRSIVGRRRSRWSALSRSRSSDLDRRQRAAQRTMKLAAAVFVAVSITSVFLVWHALREIDGTHSRMTAVINQLNSRAQSPPRPELRETHPPENPPPRHLSPPPDALEVPGAPVPGALRPGQPLEAPRSTHGRGSRGSRLPSSTSLDSDGSPRS